MMPIRICLLTLLCLLVPRTIRAPASVIRYEASHDAMGTVFNLIAYGQDREYLASVANDVFDEIDRLDAQMSNYKPESELSRINRTAGRQSVVVDRRLFRLIEDSIRYSRETNGAFDITVGPLMRSWGFLRGHGRLPSPSEVIAVLKHVGYRHLNLDAAQRTVRFDQEGIEIDLGGIAKGYAVDQAVEVLRSNGITSALVSSGTSSVYALGAPLGERGWKITLRDPYDGAKAAEVIYLQNYSLSTSGNYEKLFRLSGKLYTHIMDPRTGVPVEGVLSASVLAPQATQSDALSTAFFVLGTNGSRKYLAAHPNLTVIFCLPTDSKSRFKRVLLRSTAHGLPPETLAHVEKP